eukprot:scaffold3271_cov46-Cyclotella_meneghiniana.AAC.4
MEGFLNQCKQITAAGLFQCLIISIMNGMTRLRLEFILRNVQANPSSRTVPMSHPKYNEWYDKAEIG